MRVLQRSRVFEMNEEMEPEVLSYQEFKKRETLLAWQRRRRSYESRAGEESEVRSRGFMHLPRGGAGSGASSRPR
jgi:hypothetical protein